jgi:dihydroorotate dehydrogenase electron transfer subunit
MLEALWSMVKGREIPTYVSMEENMACGIGACLGCVVRTVDGHKRVCKEGPIFSIDEIVW